MMVRDGYSEFLWTPVFPNKKKLFYRFAERTGFFRLKALNPFLLLRGENRIRTCEPVLPVTRFPGVPLQPLEHLSKNALHPLKWI